MSTPFTCKPAQRTFIGSSFPMIYRPLITLILMLSLLIATPAFSANYQQGFDAYIKGGFVTALEHWRPLAKQDHARAQNSLGGMYGNGHGVPQDYKTAVKWYRLAAEQDHAMAQFNIGIMYDNGHGVPQDYKTAVKWYALAAEQDHADAQYNLGGMYGNGHGVPQDYKTAVKWYTLAAEQGVAQAQYNLGLKYASGQGVPQDYIYGHMWLNIAVSNGGNPKARDILTQKMTPSQIEEAQNRAREWVIKHGG